MLGHKADACLLVLGPDLWRLHRFQAAVRRSGAELVWSYTSLTELSEYADGLPEEMKQARLYPSFLPRASPPSASTRCRSAAVDEHNWYALGFDERKELMIGHGAVGRRFRGRVLQLVTGSTGWTTGSGGSHSSRHHPDDLKECVYEMRFDVASARYAEFGPFVTGMVGEADELVPDSRATRSGDRARL